MKKLNVIVYLIPLLLSVTAVKSIQTTSETSEFSLRAATESLIEYVEAQGENGPYYYVLFLAIWVVLLLPCSILEIVPGFLFGFKTGWAVSVAGKVLGSLLSIILAKLFFKSFLSRYLFDKYPILITLKKAINKEGFKVILLIRVTYLPMLLKNYGMAVMDVPTLKIIGASFCAGVPFAAGWAFLGASAKNLPDILEGKMKFTDAFPDHPAFLPLVSLGGVLFVYVLYNFTKTFNQLLKETNAEKDK
eukprot:snap_masked-scaffold_48-processed-gene-1.79-mRNA-1 protein AED:0.35 eAED:0.36 QI:0/-1/0/1/-1/1/1/0/246